MRKYRKVKNIDNRDKPIKSEGIKFDTINLEIPLNNRNLLFINVSSCRL